MNPKHSMLVLALAATALVAANVNARDDKPHDMANMKGHEMSNMQDMKGHSAGSMELHKAMMADMKMPMKMTGNVDKDFAMMMTVHHQQAIRMADVLLKHGSNAELKALARKMKAAQQTEIKQLAPYAK